MRIAAAIGFFAGLFFIWVCVMATVQEYEVDDGNLIALAVALIMVMLSCVYIELKKSMPTK